MADEEYYLTAQYLVQIASRAKELFAGSEPEEKRLLLNMTLQNLRLDGKIVLYDWIKPFDKIAFYASRPSWLPQQVGKRTVERVRDFLFRSQFGLFHENSDYVATRQFSGV